MDTIADRMMDFAKSILFDEVDCDIIGQRLTQAFLGHHTAVAYAVVNNQPSVQLSVDRLTLYVNRGNV
jgi:hypothetical protein